jgi:predicted nucleic acid-binding protein
MAKTDDKRIFVDTNVLLAATDTSRDQHAEAIQFLDGALKGDQRLFVIAQIFREYLVVATRPLEANGLGLSSSDASDNVCRFQRFLEILPEDGKTTDHLLLLIREGHLKGKRIHDANLVASMVRHGLRKLKTYNPADFKSFSELDIL